MAKKKKMCQYVVKTCGTNNIKREQVNGIYKYVVHEEDLVDVKMSANSLLEKYSGDDGVLKNFIVFHFQQGLDGYLENALIQCQSAGKDCTTINSQAMLKYIIAAGVYIQRNDGSFEHMRGCIQSPAQRKGCNFYMTSLDVMSVINFLGWGHSFVRDAKKGDITDNGEPLVVISKALARLSQSLTCGIKVDYVPHKIVVDDPVMTSTEDVVKVSNEDGRLFDTTTSNANVVWGKEEVSFTPHDGQSYMEVFPYIKLCGKLEYIKDVQVKFVQDNYTCIQDLLELLDEKGKIKKFDTSFFDTHRKILKVYFPAQREYYKAMSNPDAPKGVKRKWRKAFSKIQKLYDEDKVSFKEKLDEYHQYKVRKEIIHIISLVPAGLQIRHGKQFCKGMVFMFPFKSYTHKFDEYEWVCGDNFCKSHADDFNENADFRVCNATHIPHKNGRVKLNYQILQNLILGASSELLIEMAKKDLANINDKVFKDADSALAFIGGLTNVDTIDIDRSELLEEATADDDEDKRFVSLVQSALETNPNFLKDSYILNKLKDMVIKKILMTSFGKLEVDGYCSHLVTDPFLFFSKHDPENKKLQSLVMKENEVYINGKTGTWGFFRCPMTSPDQAVVLEGQDRKDMFYMKGAAVFNGIRPHLMRMNGADTDGDECFCTNDPRILNVCKKNGPLPIEVDAPAPKVPFNLESINKYLAEGYEVNPIGIVSNNITSEMDLINGGVKGKNDKLLAAYIFYLQEVVDMDKHGKKPEEYKQLNQKKKPWWNKMYKAALANRKKFVRLLITNKEADANIEIFKEKVADITTRLLKDKSTKNISYTNSPLSRLAYFGMNYVKEFVNEDFLHNDDIDLAYEFYNQVNQEEVDRLLPMVRQIRYEFMPKSAKLFNDFYGKGKVLYQHYDELVEEYRSKLLVLSKDAEAVAVAAYIACYEQRNSGEEKTAKGSMNKLKSLAWNVMRKELLELGAKFGKARDLIRIPSYVTHRKGYDGIAKIDNTGSLTVGNVTIGEIPQTMDHAYNNSYEIKDLGYGRFVISIPRPVADATYKYTEVPTYPIDIKITKKKDMDSQEIKEFLNKNTFEIIEKKGRFYISTPLGDLNIKKTLKTDKGHFNYLNQIFKLVGHKLKLNTPVTNDDLFSKKKDGTLKTSLVIDISVKAVTTFTAPPEPKKTTTEEYSYDYTEELDNFNSSISLSEEEYYSGLAADPSSDIDEYDPNEDEEEYYCGENDSITLGNIDDFCNSIEEDFNNIPKPDDSILDGAGEPDDEDEDEVNEGKDEVNEELKVLAKAKEIYTNVTVSLDKPMGMENCKITIDKEEKTAIVTCLATNGRNYAFAINTSPNGNGTYNINVISDITITPAATQYLINVAGYMFIQ